MNTLERLVLKSMSSTEYRTQRQIEKAAEQFTGTPVRFHGFKELVAGLGGAVRQCGKTNMAWRRLRELRTD